MIDATPKVARENLEQEAKFEVSSDFEVPDLRAVVGGTERWPELELRAAYFDSADFRLWERGITFRHRRGEESGPGTWTVKLPSGGGGPTLDRTELSWSGDRDEIPLEAGQLLHGLVRRAVLRQVAELVTSRRRLVFHDTEARTWGELDDDTVTVVGGDRDGFGFRQLEVELRGDGAPALAIVIDQLRLAGAEPETTSKLAKALGLPSPGATGREGGGRKAASVADVVRASIALGLAGILERDYRLRLNPAEPGVEDIHQARVAARRLRSDLKTFGTVLDPLWCAHSRTELQWLGSALGRVRDIDVMTQRFLGGGEPTAMDAQGHREIRERLAGERRVAIGELTEVLAGDRYRSLLDRLHAASQAPPFYDGPASKAVRSGTGAGTPATEMLPHLVLGPWDALHRKVRRAGRHPDDRQLHQIRIGAKQLRYAAEAATPIMGKPARRTAQAAEALQTVLGNHHDAVAAEEWLRSRASSGGPAGAFLAGQLSVGERQDQRKLRHQWRPVAQRLQRKELRRWMK